MVSEFSRMAPASNSRSQVNLPIERPKSLPLDDLLTLAKKHRWQRPKGSVSDQQQLGPPGSGTWPWGMVGDGGSDWDGDFIDVLYFLV